MLRVHSTPQRRRRRARLTCRLREVIGLGAFVFTLLCCMTLRADHIVPSCGLPFEYELTPIECAANGECCFRLSFIDPPPLSDGFLLETIRISTTAPASISHAAGHHGYSVAVSPSLMSWSNAFPTENWPDAGIICLRSGDEYITLTVELYIRDLLYDDLIQCVDEVVLCCGCAIDPVICEVGKLNLTTGTAPWIVTSTVNNPGSDPYPPFVIQKHSDWSDPLPGSEWISPIESADNFVSGVTVFKRCFCLEGDFTELQIYMEMLADDHATVYLDGVIIGISDAPYNATVPPDVVNVTLLKSRGLHCVEVHVLNDPARAMGFNAFGYIRNIGPGMLVSDECCPMHPGEIDPPDIGPAPVPGKQSSELEHAMHSSNDEHVIRALRTQPNPSDDGTTVNFNLRDAGELRLQLYNAAGELQRDLAAGFYGSGSHTLLIETVSLEAGLYFLRLTTASGETAAIPLSVAP